MKNEMRSVIIAAIICIIMIPVMGTLTHWSAIGAVMWEIPSLILIIIAFIIDSKRMKRP